MEELVEFFDARDQFLSGNEKDFDAGLNGLRRCCTLPGLIESARDEARFVCEVIDCEKIRNPSMTLKQAQQAFTVKWAKLDSLDTQKHLQALAVGYAALVEGWNLGLLRVASNKGNSFAMGELSSAENSFTLARKAAENGDRMGMKMLAFCFETGKDGCKTDMSLALFW